MVKQIPRIYEFGPFQLIPDERQLLREGSVQAVTPKAFDLLVALVENRGHLVTKEVLLQRIWPDSFVEEANLSVKMSELRRALGEGAKEQAYIETVPRSGYRFVADVVERSDEVDIRIGASDPPAQESRLARELVPSVDPRAVRETDPTRVSVTRWAVPAVALALAIVGLIAFDVAGYRTRLFGASEPPSIHSLAVLPLANLSGDATQDYFAEGMTEALITELSKIGSMRVISRPSVMQFKDSRTPLTEIGRELNVDAVVTGSVLRAGDRVRISVQLTNVKTQQNLWTESYERDLSDVLTLQREVTRDIVGEVRVKLSPQQQLQFGKAPPVDPAAYDQYLKGKFYLYRQTKEDNEKAIAALEQAAASDPTFAAAFAELAQAYVWKLFLFAPNEEQLKEKAFVATEKAISMDPDLAVAHLARGRLLWTPANHFPHAAAIVEYRRALELNPNLDEARNQLALIYNHIGAFDEALRELERAVATNPNNSQAQFRIGETLLFQGKYEQALAAFRSVPNEANPGLVGHQLVWALWNLGRTDEASATLEKYLADYPDDNRGLFTSIQAVMAAAAGRQADAETKIQLAIEKGKGFGHFHHTAYQIACAYAQMNNAEQAVRWLDAAAKDGFPCYPLFERDKNLDNIRGDPRFVDFLANLKQEWTGYKEIL